MNRTSRLRTAVVLMVVSLSGCRTTQNFIGATRTDLLLLADALEAHRARTGQLPATLRDLCPANGSCPSGYSDREGLLIDLWGHPYAYNRAGSSFEIRSFGPDGVFSRDDIVYSPERERAQARRLAGCYRTDFSLLNEAGIRVLRLDTVPIRPGASAYKVTPSLMGKDGYWSMEDEDSIEIRWEPKYGMTLDLRVFADSLRGHQIETTEHSSIRRGRFTAHRVACSPMDFP